MNAPHRCGWVTDDPLYVAYHDHEWGVPSHDERHLFEMLNLEGAQAGLSWITILRKREGYRDAFAGFDPERMARYTPADVERLLLNPGIVRNRLKVEAALSNARAYLNLRTSGRSLDELVWSHVQGKTITRRWRSFRDAPTSTPESDALSKSLRRLGFKFVGTTICYAFMQAVGMVDDHEAGCIAVRHQNDTDPA